MKANELISESRAKIIWGDPSSSVRSFPTSNGISDIDADVKFREFNAERNFELRKIGTKKAIIGAALTVGSCIFFYWSLSHVDIDKMNYRIARVFAAISIVIALGGFYGLSKLIDGIIYLFRPQSISKSISEM